MAPSWSLILDLVLGIQLHLAVVALKGVGCLLAAFGGLLRDPIGSTEYWEMNRAVMRFLLLLLVFFSFFLKCYILL